VARDAMRLAEGFHGSRENSLNEYFSFFFAFLRVSSRLKKESEKRDTQKIQLPEGLLNIKRFSGGPGD
jgi:hypothetical protein